MGPVYYFLIFNEKFWFSSLHTLLMHRSDTYFKSNRYSEILQACALDLDISLMMGGDMACIGEKGMNLSGGQRARLALAR